jgi:hypothetical protein
VLCSNHQCPDINYEFSIIGGEFKYDPLTDSGFVYLQTMCTP